MTTVLLQNISLLYVLALLRLQHDAKKNFEFQNISGLAF